MTIHSPVYHKKNPQLRVACRSNGVWQAQRRGEEEGGTSTVDPWKGLHRWTTKNVALAQMEAAASREQS